MSKGQKHRWSGWPGAYCMICGFPDLLEIAIGKGDFDPGGPNPDGSDFPSKWIGKDMEEIYKAMASDCPAEIRKTNAIMSFAYWHANLQLQKLQENKV